MHHDTLKEMTLLHPQSKSISKPKLLFFSLLLHLLFTLCSCSITYLLCHHTIILNQSQKAKRREHTRNFCTTDVLSIWNESNQKLVTMFHRVKISHRHVITFLRLCSILFFVLQNNVRTSFPLPPFAYSFLPHRFLEPFLLHQLD